MEAAKSCGWVVQLQASLHGQVYPSSPAPKAALISHPGEKCELMRTDMKYEYEEDPCHP